MTKYRKTLVAAVVLASGLSSGAIADGYEYEPVAVAPASVDRWSGPYIGIHGGWLWSESEADFTSQSNFNPASVGVTFPLSFNNDTEGFMGGVQAGTGAQFGGWYLGAEGDVSWTDIDQTTVFVQGLPAFADRRTTVTSDMEWFGTLRLRLGVVASPNFLVYATGGAAFADIDHKMTSVQPLGGAPTNIPIRGSGSSDFEAGWTVGGGGEWAFGSLWSVKAEYLYYDLGDTNVRLANPPLNPQVLNYEFENTGHIARVGINYRFPRPASVPLK